jgi:hypothetical protein
MILLEDIEVDGTFTRVLRKGDHVVLRNLERVSSALIERDLGELEQSVVTTDNDLVFTVAVVDGVLTITVTTASTDNHDLSIILTPNNVILGLLALHALRTNDNGPGDLTVSAYLLGYGGGRVDLSAPDQTLSGAGPYAFAMGWLLENQILVDGELHLELSSADAWAIGDTIVVDLDMLEESSSAKRCHVVNGKQVDTYLAPDDSVEFDLVHQDLKLDTSSSVRLRIES